MHILMPASTILRLASLARTRSVAYKGSRVASNSGNEGLGTRLEIFPPFFCHAPPFGLFSRTSNLVKLRYEIKWHNVCSTYS
jgi:hypothetical protein